MFNFISSTAGNLVQGVANKFKLESDEDEEHDQNIQKKPKHARTPSSSKSVEPNSHPASPKKTAGETSNSPSSDTVKKGGITPTNIEKPIIEHSKSKNYAEDKSPDNSPSIEVQELRKQVAELKREIRRKDAEDEKKEQLQQEMVQKVISQREEAINELKKCKEELKNLTDSHQKELEVLKEDKENLVKKFSTYEEFANKKSLDYEEQIKNIKKNSQEIREKLEAKIEEYKLVFFT